VLYDDICYVLRTLGCSELLLELSGTLQEKLDEANAELGTLGEAKVDAEERLANVNLPCPLVAGQHVNG